MKAKNAKAAEAVMRDGWEVVSVNYWSYWKTCLLITLSREV